MMTSPAAPRSELQECRSYLNAAERLIRTSAEAVCSFFLETKGKSPFVGFLRDSLINQEALKPSTGGLSVAAALFEITPELYYVSSSTDTSTDNLKDCRDKTRDFYVDLARKIPIRKAFGPFNALTFSVAAYLSAAELPVARWTARTAFFNAMNLAYFVGERWPLLENVDKAHPYVAYSVLRAAFAFASSERRSKLLDFLKDQELVKSSNVDIPDSKPDEINQKFREHTKALGSDEPALEQLWRRAVVHFEEEAERYLWEQTSYAPRQTGSKLDSLEYDPVGACFALNILERCAVALHQDAAIKYLLGAHGSLILRSIQNILEATSASGALPNGVPFSYDPRGMGAFVTSVSGLAALTRFLCRLLQNARSNGYPSSDVLLLLFSENAAAFQKLFALAAIFDSSPRRCVISAPDLGIAEGKDLHGWWTDRAPSHKRVESWVTIEVFLFAVYLREVIQEYAQLLVLRKYGGVWPSSEPDWPYDPNTDLRANTLVRVPTGTYLRDPDEGETGNLSDPDASDTPPIPFLHQSFRKFMVAPGKDKASPDWKQDVSSVLLFGPPGTAKTTTIKSLAQKLGWHFLELTPSNFIIDGLELIEQRAKDIFDDLGSLRETVILFDELDSIFIDRELLETGSIVNFLVPAMLPKLQTLTRRAKRQRLLIAIATNFYDRLDPAVVRRGRIDKHLLVLPYNHHARLRFIKDHCGSAALNPAFESQILEQTSLYVFEELKQLAASAKTNGWHDGSAKPPDKFAFAAIGPTLYMSRIPKDATSDLTHIRSTQRLAVEVCGVVQRLNEKPRSALQGDGVKSLINDLSNLEKGLTDVGWQALCQRLRLALEAAQSSQALGSS